MADKPNDVKTPRDSSPLGERADVQPGDEMGASSASDQSGQEGEIGNQSLNEFVKNRLKQADGDAPDAEGAETENKADESNSENELDKSDKAAEGEEGGDDNETKKGDVHSGEEDPDKAAEGENQGDNEGNDETKEGADQGVENENDDAGPVPYSRFQEKVAEVNDYKQRLEQVEPQVKNYREIAEFCASNEITPDQFNTVLNIQALLNTDPMKALEQLRPLVDQLEGFAGNRLPADLQAKVDTGKLEIEDAREMAKLRAQTAFKEQRFAHDQKRVEADRAAERNRQFTDASRTWETSKRATDPDYRPKKSENSVDGVWELTRDKYLAAVGQTDQRGNYVYPVRNVQDMTQLMEKSYKSAKAIFAQQRAASRKPTGKFLSSNGSSKVSKQQTIEGAPTMKEAVRIALAQRQSR